VTSGQTAASYAPAALANGVTYFWQVVARNTGGATPGALWSFTTAPTAPPPPGTPASSAPVNGATGVGTAPTLTWTSTGATSYDVSFGTTNPPPQVTSGQTAASYTPAALASGVTYFWQIVAHNTSGATPGPVWSLTTGSAPTDVVIYASDVPPGGLHGAWAFAGDPASPNTTKLTTPASGASNLNAPLAAPTDYVDVSFSAGAGTPYTFWMRLEAFNNSKASDSVWVQFSDAQVNGAAIYPLATTSALLVKLATDTTAASDVNWGWVNSAYWLTQPATVTFATSGVHTVRVQVRGAGVMFDQIVLSPNTYLNAAPGIRTNDSTIVPKPVPPQPPGAPASPSPGNGATGTSTTPTLTWTSTGATSYDISFGTANPPPQVSAGQAAASFTPATLSTNTNYFWQIVAHNAAGSTSSPIWSFTTNNVPPPPPSTPVSPSPADGATGTSTALTLAWSSTAATSYDVNFGTSSAPPQVSAGQAAASFVPGALSNGTTYFWQVVAHNAAGTTTGPVWSLTTAVSFANPEIVIYASDIPPANLHGVWSAGADPTSPNGVKLVTPDNGSASTTNPVAAPADYVDVTFNANAGTAYTLWLRMKALNNSKLNDSLWVQFSDALASGSPIYPLNTTSGLDVNLATDATGNSLNQWGWQNTGYWLSQPTTVTFATSGTHTMRIQIREDGVQLDQIVLSSARYLNTAPGGATSDTTIVPKP
jgi:hypothetical protein